MKFTERSSDMMEQKEAKQTVDTHIRFKRDEYQLIKDVAHDNNVKISPLVRHATGRNLAKYLSSIHYLDEKQGAEIMRVLNELNTATQQVRIELKRIGINIDQQTKVIHDKKREMDSLSGLSYDEVLIKQRLMKEVAECEALSLKNQEESRIVIAEYDRVLSEVGEQLWHIQK